MSVLPSVALATTATSALNSQLEDFLHTVGPAVFYLAVWGLVFVGTAAVRRRRSSRS